MKAHSTQSFQAATNSVWATFIS